MTASPGSLRVELVRPLSLYRSWIVLAMVVCGLGVAAVRYFSQPQYSVTAILLPTSTNDQTASGSSGGIAALANLGVRGIGAGRAVSPFERFMYLIDSPELGQWQIDHHDMRPIVFENRWDSEHKTWKTRQGMLAGILGSSDPGRAPDAYDISREYDSHIGIKRLMSGSNMTDPSGMVSVTYTDTSPERAYALMNAVITDTNELLRQDAAVRAAVQAEYLRGKLATVTVDDYRQTLQKLLSDQEQTLMLTNSHLPYAAQLVSGQTLPPALLPKRTALFGAIGAGFGFCFAFLLAILHYNLRRDRAGTRSVKQTNRVPVFSTLARSLGLAKAH